MLMVTASCVTFALVQVVALFAFSRQQDDEPCYDNAVYALAGLCPDWQIAIAGRYDQF